jgi:toxin FitB
MYLLDTDVISEIRKGEKANAGVRAFFADTSRESVDLYLSVVTIGELRQGVERIRHRRDDAQAKRLERWLNQVTTIYAESILSFDEDTVTGDNWTCRPTTNKTAG